MKSWVSTVADALCGTPPYGRYESKRPGFNELVRQVHEFAQHEGSWTIGLEVLMRYVLVHHPTESSRAVVTAYGVETDALTLNGNQKAVPSAAAPALSEEALRVILRAHLMVDSAGKPPTSVAGSDVLVSLLTEPRSADVLSRVGLTKLKVTYYLTHGTVLPETIEDELWEASPHAGDVWVRIKNDDYTPMVLVTEILAGVFGLPQAEASSLTEEIHRWGAGYLGPYAHAEARHLALQGLGLARRSQAPLAVSLCHELPDGEPNRAMHATAKGGA
jgi:ATP-dependent Clp protease adapter protein ClpS